MKIAKRIILGLVVLLLTVSLASCLDDNDVNNSISTTPTLSTPSATSPHVHVFSNATCTAPRTCSCGATEGTPSEHSWTDSTCTDPKTCTTCSTAEGTPKGHAWKDATCTDPKTCTTCGSTEGNANGHDWQQATCLSPQKCVTCGDIVGTVSPHTYSNGQCTVCGVDRMVWIPTNGGTKYHTNSDCSNMKNPEQVTQRAAEARGFTPCSRCH